MKFKLVEDTEKLIENEFFKNETENAMNEIYKLCEEYRDLLDYLKDK